MRLCVQPKIVEGIQKLAVVGCYGYYIFLQHKTWSNNTQKRSGFHLVFAIWNIFYVYGGLLEYGDTPESFKIKPF